MININYGSLSIIADCIINNNTVIGFEGGGEKGASGYSSNSW